MAVAEAKSRAKRAKEELYRQLILEVAQPIFADRGYDEAKIGEIAGGNTPGPGS